VTVRKTSRQTLDEAKVNLDLLKYELESFLRGEWRYEYFYTIAYRKVYTGHKVYTKVLPTLTEHPDEGNQ
jgi:hypothetical protein